MKLLFDQNISFRTVKRLQSFFSCDQVRNLGLENKSDSEIWNFARQENYSIVTFDADFYDLVTLYGHPPKVIWLRLGNTSTDNLVYILQSHVDLIKAFITEKDYAEIGCLEID